MSKHLSMFLCVTVLFSATLAMNGCQFRRVGVDLAVFRNTLTEPGQGVTISTTAVASPTLSPPAPPKSVMLVRVSALPGTADTDEARYWRVNEDGKDLVWIVPEGVNDAQERLTRERVHTLQVRRLSESANLPAQMHPGAVLVAARNQGVDWVCAYSADSSYSGYGSNFLLALAQVVTLGLTPTTSDARCTMQLMIMDLRTNTIIDQWQAEETAWQPAVGLTLKDASRQSADRAETRALRAILDRIDRTLAATEPESTRRTPKRTDGEWQK
ncbi:MAG: hypothetical protein K2W85_10275 [Phycisphaerales bacterium]|nr:hypothetical protein [Phycisphaerales bacterium]